MGCVFHDVWLLRKATHQIGPLLLSTAILGMVLSGQALGVKLFWVLVAYALSYRISSKYTINTFVAKTEE